MRILYVIDSMTKDGAESQLLKTITQFTPDQYEVFVVLSRAEGERISELAALPCVQDVTTLSGESGRMKLIEKAFTLGGIIKAVQPDIVHSWLWYSNFLCGVSRRFGLLCKIPFIASQRGDYYARYGKFRLWLTEKLIYRATDCLLTNSEQIQRHLLKLYPRKRVLSIPNLLELPTEVWIQKQRESSEEKLIVSVGRFAPEKGHRFLIEALSLLNKNYVHWRCKFLGDGELESELRVLTAKHNLSDKVMFPGFCEDIFSELLKSDLFVLPSLHEGSPNALIEAMGIGIPCIATDVGGIKDLIDNEKNGISIPSQDSVALETAIHRMLTEPEFASELGKNARKTIQQRFNTEESIRKLEEIYQSFV
ncbi:glycosyltransferase [Candidatus Poribacteria bacterium]|nr:glycosyltransferase [Candidatus Poribacteria bacterium]